MADDWLRWRKLDSALSDLKHRLLTTLHHDHLDRPRIAVRPASMASQTTTPAIGQLDDTHVSASCGVWVLLWGLRRRKSPTRPIPMTLNWKQCVFHIFERDGIVVASALGCRLWPDARPIVSSSSPPAVAAAEF